MNYRVTDPKGICPDGWHLPTREEWEGLFLPYPKAYSLQYYGKEGLSRLHLDIANGGIRKDGFFEEESQLSPFSIGFWSSTHTMEDQEYMPWYCHFWGQYDMYNWLGVGRWAKKDMPHSRYYSVRCIKDN